jgi:proteic killer suppression protein
MIKSFRSKETGKLFNREYTKIVPADLLRIAHRKLLWLNAAICLDDLRVPPGNKLELLKGNRKGQYSIRINQKYRICFIWREFDAFDVEIADYH